MTNSKMFTVECMNSEGKVVRHTASEENVGVFLQQLKNKKWTGLHVTMTPKQERKRVSNEDVASWAWEEYSNPKRYYDEDDHELPPVGRGWGVR